ncbi:TLDc domain-containing protein [Entamoeba marina]
MDFVKPFIPQLQEWTSNKLEVKGLLFDSNFDECTASCVNSKICYHRNVMYIVKVGENIFGAFIGETIPWAEEKMSNAIDNDWKHFIFSLQNSKQKPVMFKPSYYEDFTTLFIYGTLNKRNLLSSPNAFYINPGCNCYVSKNCFEYYEDPEDIGVEIFVGSCQPQRFEAERIIIIEWEEKE